MNKRGLIGTIGLIVILIVVGFFWFVGERSGEDGVGDLNECVPASCCHANECVLKGEAPNCSGKVCTMDCRPETMDCGQGRCEIINGECGVVRNE